jgi:NAD(P)-dependent dehydrogenase (short-subunit alcohol dehydrogenase family)
LQRGRHGGDPSAARVTLTGMVDGALALAGKAALVTGGGSGIGLACARHLLRDGASVTITGRSEEKLRAAADELRAMAPDGTAVAFAAGDVGREEDVERMVVSASEAAGGLHLAVAGAGTGALAPIVSTPAQAWNDVIGTNLTGAFFTIKHAAAAMLRAGGGAIVGISSIAGPLTHRFMAAYCVSKAGLETLVRNAADELGPTVRVNAVCPGLVPTDLAAPLVNQPEVLDDYLSQMPLGRTGTVDEVASVVRFLLGPESSWVTGQIIAVDGGHTLRRGPNVEPIARFLYGDDVVEGRLG